MYVPTYFDFVNVSTIYLPFVGIALFSDIAILDKASRTEEIAYVSSRNPIRIFFQRFLISLTLLLGYILLANGVFRITQQFRDEMMIEPISLFTYVINAGGGSLFIGGMAMTISALINNVYVGYGFSIVYWLYWNINCEAEAFLNPFPFIANPTFYEVPLIIIYGFSIGLTMLACFIYRESPFYLADKMRKLIFHS
jgi:ABC-type proline/glycine betaine transport system permease subunit